MQQKMSVILLLMANLVPLAGVVFFAWDVTAVLLVYWAENLVIGGYNVLKIVFLPGMKLSVMGTKLFFVLFFTIHYGLFTAGHGAILIDLFDVGGKDVFSLNSSGFGPLIALGMLNQVANWVWLNSAEVVRWAMLVLVISHGVSFLQHYWLGGERLRCKPGTLMGRPYRRVIVMHVVVLIGGLIAEKIGEPVAILVVLILGKVIMDIKLHEKSHHFPGQNLTAAVEN